MASIPAIRASSLIVTNHPICTSIGRDLHRLGGTAQDIFIGTSLCEGVVNPMDSGIGGGFQAVVANNTCREFINSRETSPHLFPPNYPPSYPRHYPRHYPHHYPSQLLPKYQIGIPSMLKGYEYLYFNSSCGPASRLSWATLIQPSIDLARNGFPMSQTLQNVLHNINGLETLLIIDRQTGLVKNPRLASLLTFIAQEGGKSSLYEANGTLLNVVQHELLSIGSMIREQDFIRYKVEQRHPINCTFKGMTVVTTDLPGSGVCICFFLSLLDYINPINLSWWHKFIIKIQAIRYMYIIQPYLLEFPFDEILNQIPLIALQIEREKQQNPFNVLNVKKFGNLTLRNLDFGNVYGTSHINVKIGSTQLSATSSINHSFGSKIPSRLGFFYNNQLDDFSKQFSSRNFYSNDARPQSSMSGTIIIDRRGHPVFSIGAAGGKKIIGAIANTLYNYFINRMTLKDAVAYPRCIPLNEILVCEPSLPHHLKNLVLRFTNRLKWGTEAGYSAVTASTTLRKRREAIFDPRRGGSGIVL